MMRKISRNVESMVNILIKYGFSETDSRNFIIFMKDHIYNSSIRRHYGPSDNGDYEEVDDETYFNIKASN